ncbi:MAG: site-specific DNA-methyltransferase [Methylobacter sp.]
MPTLTWVGKDKVVNHHHDVPFRVLCHESHFEAPEGTPVNSTGNRIIHGDNLEALKSLLPEFEGQVNCIYIDPPYNTGNEEWVYNDAVNDPKIKKWLGQVVGKEGEDLSRHDKWLCMMYPRLKLLHRLLAKDGVIFVSLDENEISNFRLILEEVFGEHNFLVQIIVQSNKRGQTYKQIAKTHEYLICFGKTAEAKLGELETEGSNLPEQDDVGRYSSRELRNRNPKFGKHNRPNLFYPIFVNPSLPDSQGNFPVSIEEQPGSIEILPFNSMGIESCWRWGSIKVSNNTQLNSTNVLFAKQTREGGWRVFEKYRKETVKAKSIWLDTKHISEQGTTELGRLGLSDSFQFPKPVGLLEDCLMLATDDNSIILDSFAGSGTTAHAVLKQNAQDKGNRRFILIETMDYAETLTAERVRRVMSGYGEGEKQVAGLGGGFDYYTVGEPIFNDDDTLNEAVGIEEIRYYIAYSEGIPSESRTVQENVYTPYLLGLDSETAWVFYYEPEEVTCLDLDFLSSLKFGASKPGTAIIYADKCLLTKEFMTKHSIIFKKIPRDITRF